MDLVDCPFFLERLYKENTLYKVCSLYIEGVLSIQLSLAWSGFYMQAKLSL